MSHNAETKAQRKYSARFNRRLSWLLHRPVILKWTLLGDRRGLQDEPHWIDFDSAYAARTSAVSPIRIKGRQYWVEIFLFRDAGNALARYFWHLILMGPLAFLMPNPPEYQVRLWYQNPHIATVNAQRSKYCRSVVSRRDLQKLLND